MKEDKKLFAILISLLIALVIDFSATVMHIANYDDRKAEGNARWEQVEERIVEVEQRMNIIENK